MPAVEDTRADARRMLEGLLAASHLMPLEALPARVTEHAAAAGLTEVSIYIADVQGNVLRLLTGDKGTGEAGPGQEAELKVEGTLPGRSYQYVEVLADRSPGARGHRWWVPLLDGTERLGVLRISTADDTGRTQQDMVALASLIALILVSKRGHSDAYARLTRAEPMNIAAEMQWHLMPPRSYADGRMVIAAAMEPAYRISGDAFDYATAGPIVHLSIFDAMGHDTAAGLSANLAMAACRNARRQDAGLVEITERIEQALIDQYGQTRYVTGIVADLDTTTGTLTWVNRGHHPPVVIRGGGGSASCAAGRPTPWAPASAWRHACAVNSSSPATGSCATPTASPRPGARGTRSSGWSGSWTSCSATTPTASPCRRPCAASCTPSWSTTAAA